MVARVAPERPDPRRPAAVRRRGRQRGRAIVDTRKADEAARVLSEILVRHIVAIALTAAIRNPKGEPEVEQNVQKLGESIKPELRAAIGDALRSVLR